MLKDGNALSKLQFVLHKRVNQGNLTSRNWDIYAMMLDVKSSRLQNNIINS